MKISGNAESDAIAAKADHQLEQGGPAPTIFCVFIEPTPYITRLASELKHSFGRSLEVFYLTTRESQPWQKGVAYEADTVLPTGTFTTLLSFAAALLTSRPAVVFVSGWGRLKTAGILILSRLLGARTIVSSDTWRSREGRTADLARSVVFKFVSHFAPGGSRQAQYLLKRGVPATRATKTNMTVDTAAMMRFFERNRREEHSVRRSLGVPTDAVVVLFVGRLAPEKDIETLIHAFREIEINENVFLLIVGDGPQKLLLQEIAEGDARIIFLGRQENTDLWSIYSIADIFTAPSKEEPWGLVVNEAMAAALPVIVTDRFGCLDDLVTHEHTGLVIAAGDLVALHSALRRLISDPEARARLGAAGRKRISAWTIEAQAKNVRSIIAQVR